MYNDEALQKTNNMNFGWYNLNISFKFFQCVLAQKTTESEICNI